MTMTQSLRGHWPEYLIEGWGLGTFMFAVCALVVAAASPISPLYTAVPNPIMRAVLLALAVGLVLSLIILSPWGKRSGAHFNPAITLAFWRLGKVRPWDAMFYVMAQVIGALGGVLLASLVLGPLFTDPPVEYAATLPGARGVAVAFVAETIISFALMQTILIFVGSKDLMPFTAVAVGALVALFIVIEGPLSGSSMNPARTLASAVPGGHWDHLWVYLVAPTLGMGLAAQLRRWIFPTAVPGCAKLIHADTVRCIHCGHEPAVASRAGGKRIPARR